MQRLYDWNDQLSTKYHSQYCFIMKYCTSHAWFLSDGDETSKTKQTLSDNFFNKPETSIYKPQKSNSSTGERTYNYQSGKGRLDRGFVTLTTQNGTIHWQSQTFTVQTCTF